MENKFKELKEIVPNWEIKVSTILEKQEKTNWYDKGNLVELLKEILPKNYEVVICKVCDCYESENFIYIINKENASIYCFDWYECSCRFDYCTGIYDNKHINEIISFLDKPMKIMFENGDYNE